MLSKRLLLLLSALTLGRAQGSYCPITVSYEVSLGQAPLATPLQPGGVDDFSDIPIFFGKIGIFSNNVSLSPSSCTCECQALCYCCAVCNCCCCTLCSRSEPYVQSNPLSISWS